MKGITIWLTGLSGSGKSTIANKLIEELNKRNIHPELLDGDIIRENLSKGLTFSPEDVHENNKRITFVCKLLTKHGVFNIVSAISPFKHSRNYARKEIGNFLEVFVKCPLEICKKRDVKGLYTKVEKGEITNFLGIHTPYEEPENPEVVVETHKENLEESTKKIIDKLKELNYL